MAYKNAQVISELTQGVHFIMMTHDLTQPMTNPIAPNAINTNPVNMRQIVTLTARQYLANLTSKELQNSELYNLFLYEMEQSLFEEVLRFTGGNESKAARILGVSRGTLRQRRELFGHYEKQVEVEE